MGFVFEYRLFWGLRAISSFLPCLPFSTSFFFFTVVVDDILLALMND
jgi:hypothetical protein